MTVGWIPFKFPHSDPITNLTAINIPQWGAGKLTFKYEIYPVIKGIKLPIRVRLTYRVHRESDDIAIFSIVGEGEAHLEFTKGEDAIEELKRLLHNFQLQIELHWEEKTLNTSLYGNTIKGLAKELEDKFIQNVIEVARQNNLL